MASFFVLYLIQMDHQFSSAQESLVKHAIADVFQYEKVGLGVSDGHPDAYCVSIAELRWESGVVQYHIPRAVKTPMDVTCAFLLQELVRKIQFQNPLIHRAVHQGESRDNTHVNVQQNNMMTCKLGNVSINLRD